MKFEIPKLALVVLIGPSGSGKSTFARRHFKPTEIISSDTCRGLVSDDESSMDATRDAFDVVRYIAGKRLKNGLLTVIDATSVRAGDRSRYVELAREHHVLPVAIVLDVPESVCIERNAARDDRNLPARVIHRQRAAMRHDLTRRYSKGLRGEGFRQSWTLDSVEAIDAVQIERVPLWNDRTHEHGPFDIIGDVHGCFDELVELIEALGYTIDRDPDASEGDWPVRPPADAPDRTLFFVGDLVDRGPKSPAVLRLVMRLVAEGRGHCVPGNHDVKLMRKLAGRKVQLRHGLAETMEQFRVEGPEFREQVRAFIDSLVSHHVLDGGKLVIAHAGLKEEMHGRASAKVREFCLYGDTTGEVDELGLPVRLDWAADYRGRATVVYGHTVVPEAQWLNNTICVDTGCVFGGRLTALRYPERALVSVPAHEQYAEPARPLVDPDADSALTAQQQHDGMLDLADVSGQRIIETRFQRTVTVWKEQATAALEVMSRFAADPRWLIHLPPTMSPCATSERPGRLEHPDEAFAYFRSGGVAEVVCEEKHMGSRAIVVVCRDEEAARDRFGVDTGETGIIYTRTGRRFFNDSAIETAMLDRVRGAIAAAGLWDELETTWFCLDCELMPWSAKAQALIREQYAAVGSAARTALAAAIPVLEATAERVGGDEIQRLLDRSRARRTAADRFTDAYRQYCWDVESIEDYRLAPFHILASEGAVHVDRDHLWHMGTLARIAAHDPILVATEHRTVSLEDAADSDAATAWWDEMTERGGEGMVVKPRAFVSQGPRGLMQPAVKCRGPEYLRIIYGPDYLASENLERLRRRGLGRKRSLAVKEFALGIEALERFVRREPLRRVHECVFGVLALESEPVDPRL